MKTENLDQYYKKRKIISKIDIVFIIIFTIAIAVSMFFIFTSSDNKSATMYVDGKPVYTFNLYHNKVERINKYNIVVVINNGKIAIAENDCHNQICVKTGYINKSNQVIVCAPKNILISIDKKSNDNSFSTGNIFDRED